MGFKNSGFPHYGFNPLGYKTSNGLLQGLIKNCGLLSLNTPETDKVGKRTGIAVQGETLVGDGVTYVEYESLIPTQNVCIEWVGNFNAIPAATQVNGVRDGANDLFFGGQSGEWRLDWGTSSYTGGTIEIGRASCRERV